MIKNFERIPMSGMSYDCMINGIINIDEGATFKEFVDYILEHYPNDWGYVETLNKGRSKVILEYEHGKIKNIDESYLTKTIYNIRTNYGWSRSDYFINFGNLTLRVSPHIINQK